MLIILAFTCHCLGLGQVGSSRDGSGRVGRRVGRRVGSGRVGSGRVRLVSVGPDDILYRVG